MVCGMASTRHTRLAPVTARDGVDTRKKVNWASVATQPRKTICRSDAIIGLGQLAAQQSYNGSAAWGDVMTDNLPVYHASEAIRYCERSEYQVWEDLIDEPWKYGDDVCDWLDLDEKLSNGPAQVHMDSYWKLYKERLQEVETRKDRDALKDRKMWQTKFNPIVKEVAKVCAKRWVTRDIKRHVLRFKGSATKIQTLVRGYQARCKDARQDCCMCLSHRISPLKTAKGYMCRDCGVMGPHGDIVEEDPWNWNRVEFVDEAIFYTNCNWCNKESVAPLWNGDYCSYECECADRSA